MGCWFRFSILQTVPTRATRATRPVPSDLDLAWMSLDDANGGRTNGQETWLRRHVPWHCNEGTGCVPTSRGTIRRVMNISPGRKGSIGDDPGVELASPRTLSDQGARCWQLAGSSRDQLPFPAKLGAMINEFLCDWAICRILTLVAEDHGLADLPRKTEPSKPVSVVE